MKRFLVLLVLSIVFVSCGPTQTTTSTTQTTVSNPTDPERFASTILESELKEKLYVYASDEFEGRETGKPGQKKAVEYLKNQYVQLGIPSPLGKDDYFQEVSLQKVKAPEMNLVINGQTLDASQSYVSLISSNDGTFSADEIVDLGYGIDHENYSNYKDVDVKGKVVLVRSGEPKNEDGSYVITGTNEISIWGNSWRQMRAKQNAAKEHGAKVILFYYPELYGSLANRFRSVVRTSIKGNADEIYFLMVNSDVVSAINNSESTAVNNSSQAQTLSASFKLDYKVNATDFGSENVIAYIKGSEKPDEYLVITAHLDHEGIKDSKIYNGADDDGSGTVAILEIAEAFKAAADNGQGPKRSVVFLHVTAEEKGLLGSKYYTDVDPVFPLEQTVANLNIDMIGRIDPKREGDRNYVYVIGADRLSTELHEIGESANNTYTNIELDYTYNDPNDPNNFYGRSDHYNFAKNNIPIIFYFNGTHADYHKHTDTVEKIEYDLLENRTRLIFHTAWEIANRAERPKLDAPKEAGTN
ncbi:MAG: M20/M25/M40 family metallo-hydrolase [Bacteroidia bacterium]|nr:M20/M25/M40 family metallo-hydrolase [Bacteroidia bacterium]